MSKIWFRDFSLEQVNKVGRETMVSHVGIEVTDIGDDFLRGVGIDLQLLAEAAHGGEIVTGTDGPGDDRLLHRINHLLVSGRPGLELYAERQHEVCCEP